MNPKRSFLLLMVMVLSVPFTLAAPSGGTGTTLTGVVSNFGTDVLLEGAKVVVPELGITAHTDQNGRYSIPNVPAQSYTLVISYTGLDSQEIEVAGVPGQTVTTNVDLTSKVYMMQEFVIVGEREGNAASITRQKNAPNIKSVVALDAFGNLPNDNAGELLVRLSGVAGRLDDEGNITGVYIRGAEPNLTTVSVDGNLQASTGGMGRDFRTHAISGALFDELEVTKAPTPDMPSDSLGGAVNLKTGSTLNMKEKRQVTYRAAARWAPPFTSHTPTRADHRVQPLLSLKYREIFDVGEGEKNLGLSVSLFNSQNVSGYYKTVQDYEYTTADPAYLWDYRTYDGFNNRRQSSMKIRLDAKISPTTSIYFNTLYNKAEEPNNPIYYMRAYSSRTLANVAANGTVSGGVIMPGYTDTFTEIRSGTTASRVILTSYLYSFMTTEQQFNLGATHDLGAWQIDYDANYNYSHPDLRNGENGQGGGIFTMDMRRAGWTVDKSGSEIHPQFNQTSGPDIYDVDNYENGLLTVRNNDRDTDILTGAANARWTLPVALPMALKFGTKYRAHRVEEVGRDRRWRFTGGDSLAQFVNTDLVTTSGQLAGQELPFINTTLVGKDIATNPQNWTEDLGYAHDRSFIGTRHVDEKVTAGYVQLSAKVKKLDVLAGLRAERTRVESVGFVADEDFADGYGLRETKGGYSDLFPGAHFTYHFTDRFQARTSWSNSIGRPRFSDLLPVESANDTNETLNVNNPSLKPQYSSNIDFSLEYYFEPVGQLSVGYFHKSIEDFIVSDRGGVVPTGPNNGFNGDYAGYTIISEFNGGAATVEGLEFSYQQEFDFLPRPFNGLGGFVNYTKLRTRGDYGEGTQKSTDEVANFIPEMANAGLTWNLAPVKFRLLANFTGDYLASYATDASRLRYRSERTTVDAGISYSLRKLGLTLSADASNIFNEPSRYYLYSDERLQQLNLTGTTITFSVSGRF